MLKNTTAEPIGQARKKHVACLLFLYPLLMHHKNKLITVLYEFLCTLKVLERVRLLMWRDTVRFEVRPGT